MPFTCNFDKNSDASLSRHYYDVCGWPLLSTSMISELAIADLIEKIFLLSYVCSCLDRVLKNVRNERVSKRPFESFSKVTLNFNYINFIYLI